jgi:hypothetical protein
MADEPLINNNVHLPEEPAKKTCDHCQRSMYVTCFPLRKSSPDGRSDTCKGCTDETHKYATTVNFKHLTEINNTLSNHRLLTPTESNAVKKFINLLKLTGKGGDMNKIALLAGLRPGGDKKE